MSSSPTSPPKSLVVVLVDFPTFKLVSVPELPDIFEMMAEKGALLLLGIKCQSDAPTRYPLLSPL